MFGNASGRPPVTIGTMHCKACLYVLDGLDAGACPECGRAFDPADPATYATNRIDQDRPRLLLIGGGLVVVLAAIAVRSVFTYDDSTLFLVVLYGLPGILSYFIGTATLRATPSIRGVMLVCTPALLMLGSYYSLALHMRWALQGWPANIGTNGFPQSLIVHGDIAMFCFGTNLLLLLFGWPIGFLVCLVVRRWNGGAWYLGVLAMSVAIGIGLMALAPGQFTDWWWD